MRNEFSSGDAAIDSGERYAALERQLVIDVHCGIGVMGNSGCASNKSLIFASSIYVYNIYCTLRVSASNPSAVTYLNAQEVGRMRACTCRTYQQ